MKKFSMLELLHPDGIAHTSLVLGSNCPEILRPESQPRFDGNADLFVIAPSEKESNSQVWLEAAVRAMSDYLSADGIGYVLVRPLWRWRLMDLLHNAGLVMDTAFWHFPGWSTSRSLTPVARVPGQFSVNSILPAPSLKRTVAMQMFSFWPTRQMAINFWNPIGLCFRQPGARPLFEWLFKAEESAPGTAVVRRSWRGAKGAVITYGFSRHDAFPSLIVKTVAAENAESLNREAQVLADQGSDARQAGVQIPKIIARQQNDGRCSLLLSFIPGQPVVNLLARKPEVFTPVMGKIVDWLERWYQATMIVRPLKKEQFERTLLAPVNRLAPLLQKAEQYRDWLIARSTSVIPNPVPLVVTHNDLTMANVLLDKPNHIGVVDWETACVESLPLVDFYYAVTDGVQSIAQSYTWLDAFRACFLPDGFYTVMVAIWQERLQSALGISSDFAELCFHACWLHHAANEQRTAQPGEPRPFLEIVQWLALHTPESSYP